MRLYHPAYERKRDRPTRIDFLPATLDGRKVATADVPDDVAPDLIARGYRPWPAPATPEPASVTNVTGADVDAMTIAQLRAFATDHGITLPTKGTKAELRALIRTPY